MSGPGLFKYLIENNVAKEPKCTVHDPTFNNTDYRSNCAIEGYLMYKKIDKAKWDNELKKNKEDVYFKPPYEKNVTVTNSSGTTMEFRTLGPKSTSWTAKKNTFEYQTNGWKDTHFQKICKGGISYETYNQTLFGKSDWYYTEAFEPSDKGPVGGHVFVYSVDNLQRRKWIHVSTEGVFAGNFLYVTLICSNKGGFGKQMLDSVEAFCARLGYDGILLSSLEASAGVYFSVGYQFVSRESGTYVDVEEYVYIQSNEDGTPAKRMLNNTKTNVEKEEETKTEMETAVPPSKRSREEDSMLHIMQLLDGAQKSIDIAKRVGVVTRSRPKKEPIESK